MICDICHKKVNVIFLVKNQNSCDDCTIGLDQLEDMVTDDIYWIGDTERYDTKFNVIIFEEN